MFRDEVKRKLKNTVRCECQFYTHWLKVFGLVIDSEYLCYLNQPPMNILFSLLNQCEWVVSFTDMILAESKFLCLLCVTCYVFSILPPPGPVLAHIPYPSIVDHVMFYMVGNSSFHTDV